MQSDTINSRVQHIIDKAIRHVSGTIEKAGTPQLFQRTGPTPHVLSEVDRDAIARQLRGELRKIIIDEFEKQHGEEFTLRRVLQATADEYGVSVKEVRSRRRNKGICRARAVAIILCRKLTTRSLPEIARFLGNRDHTTIMHNIRVVQRAMAQDPALARRVDLIEHRLASTAPNGLPFS